MDPNANDCRSSRRSIRVRRHTPTAVVSIHGTGSLGVSSVPIGLDAADFLTGRTSAVPSLSMFFCLLMSSHGIKGDRCDLMEESWAKQMVNNMHAWPRKRQQLRVPRTRELSFFADVRPVGFRQEARREERSAPCSSRSKMLQGHRGLCVQGDRVSADWRTSPLVLTPGSVKLPMQGVDRVKGFDKRLITTLSDASPGLAQ